MVKITEKQKAETLPPGRGRNYTPPKGGVLRPAGGRPADSG